MHVSTYTEALKVFQPVIEPLYASLVKGLGVAATDHTEKKLDRDDDPHYYLHTVRRVACEELRKRGLTAINENSDKPMLAMSGILVPYRKLAVKVLHTQTGPAGNVIIPIPGRSRDRQKFWRQEAGSALPGMETDNLLLLWRDDLGKLVEPMYLVRPLGGDHRRASLVLHWEGNLSRQMATLRASDLDELRPAVYYNQLGESDAG